jgi:NACHT domain
MHFFKRHFSSPIKIIVFIFSLFVLGFSVFYLQKSITLQIVVCAAFCIFLFVFRKLWLAEEVSSKIQYLLLTIGIGLTISYTGWNPIFKEAISSFQTKYPEYKIFKEISSPLLLVGILLVISVVSYFLKQNTVLKEHPSPIALEFPEKDFKGKLKNFIKVLTNDLNNIDIEINWNEYYFTPLDADVEIISNNGKKRKVTNLLRSIKKDRRSQVFLVLGDPGSGKSTALRKLARELLNEAEITGRIPVYINLKDWQDDKEYTESMPVTANDIYSFIIKKLKGKDIFADKFIEAYFDKMYENGRIFFILDSFDEIPRVLDANENSWIIDNLSDAFYNFLAGAAESRGILSSRIFRKPTRKFKSKAILEIRPFNELRIEETFAKSINNIERGFFKKFSRSFLLPIARNPFSAALIIQFLDENNLMLPSSQSEIYRSYINKRFSSCADKLKEINISVDEVISYCTELSFIIFSSQRSGLEITISELKNKITHPLGFKTDEIISLIQFAKIGRLSPVNNKFSFVHRRFNEYFVVLKFMSDPTLINIESIPTDSRWRDSLVLFCEIAEKSFAKDVALFCWKEIRKMNNENLETDIASNDQLLRSIHCLRFLSDAFRNRKDVIADFEDEFSKLLIDNISNKESIIIKKISVETVGILEPSKMNESILAALRTKYFWISEEAFKASRFLKDIPKDLEKLLFRYIVNFDPREILLRRKEILFSSQLSEAFGKVRILIKLKIIDSCLYYLASIITIILCPPLFIIHFLLTNVGHPKKYRATVKKIYDRYLMSMCSGMFFWLMYAFPYSTQKVESKFLDHFQMLFGVTYSHRLDLPVAKYVKPLAETYPHLLAGIGIAATLFIIPFLDLFYLLKSQKFTFRKLKKIALFFLGSAVLFSLIAMAILYIINNVSGRVVLWIFLILLLIPSMVICGNIISWVHDLFKLKKIKKPIEKHFTRAQISLILCSLKLKKSKIEFLNHLDNNSIVPTGNWADNKMPNWNDYVSEHLARQEEKWLNLDR